MLGIFQSVLPEQILGLFAMTAARAGVNFDIFHTLSLIGMARAQACPRIIRIGLMLYLELRFDTVEHRLEFDAERVTEF